MLGTFHLAKAVEHCIGKMMKGSGFQDTFVERKTFGLKIVVSHGWNSLCKSPSRINYHFRGN